MRSIEERVIRVSVEDKRQREAAVRRMLWFLRAEYLEMGDAESAALVERLLGRDDDAAGTLLN